MPLNVSCNVIENYIWQENGSTIYLLQKAFYFSAVDHSFWTSCFALFVLSFSHLLCFNISFIVHTIIIITNWICQTKEKRKMETWMTILHSIIIEWLIEIDQLLSAYFSLFIEHVFQTVITYRQNIMYMNTDNIFLNFDRITIQIFLLLWYNHTV